MKAIGHFSLERSVVQKLSGEARSVQVLFYGLVSQGFTYRIAVRKPDNSYEVWGEGSRPWSQRSLAESVRMSINTVRRGLYRLTKLGLIRTAISKLGTVVQVLNFHRYRKQGTGVWETPPFSTGRDITRPGNTRSATTDHYRKSPNNITKTLTSSISDATAKWMKSLGITSLTPALSQALEKRI